jgi:hypothetical protein
MSPGDIYYIVRGEDTASADATVIHDERPPGEDVNQRGGCPDCGGPWFQPKVQPIESEPDPYMRLCPNCGSVFTFDVTGDVWWALVRKPFSVAVRDTVTQWRNDVVKMIPSSLRSWPALR